MRRASAATRAIASAICGAETPGRERAHTAKSRDRSAGSSRQGSQNCASYGNAYCGGMTPTIVKTRSSRRTRDPIAAGDRANRVSHVAWPTSATPASRPRRASSSVSGRPRSGATPSVRSKPSVCSATLTRSGASAPASVMLWPLIATSSSNTSRADSRTATIAALDMLNGCALPSVAVTISRRRIRRASSRNGNGRHST